MIAFLTAPLRLPDRKPRPLLYVPTLARCVAVLVMGVVAATSIVVATPTVAVAAPTALSGMNAAINTDGRLEAFASGADGAIWHNYITLSGPWSGWLTLGTPPDGAYSGTAVGRNLDGSLEVFASTRSGLLPVACRAWWCAAGPVGRGATFRPVPVVTGAPADRHVARTRLE